MVTLWYNKLNLTNEHNWFTFIVCQFNIFYCISFIRVVEKALCWKILLDGIFYLEVWLITVFKFHFIFAMDDRYTMKIYYTMKSSPSETWGNILVWYFEGKKTKRDLVEAETGVFWSFLISSYQFFCLNFKGVSRDLLRFWNFCCGTHFGDRAVIVIRLLVGISPVTQVHHWQIFASTQDQQT